MLFGQHQVLETEHNNKRTGLGPHRFIETDITNDITSTGCSRTDTTTSTIILIEKNEISLRIVGMFRFGAMRVCKTKDMPPVFFRRGLFEAISGYFPNPAIPPYYFRTLHFVEKRLCKQRNLCHGTAMCQVLWKHLCIDAYFSWVPRSVSRGSVDPQARDTIDDDQIIQ